VGATAEARGRGGRFDTEADRVPDDMLYTILIILAIVALLLFVFGRRSA
jgi:hypothetical protein